MKTNTEKLNTLLHRDSLAEAEQITGKSYKNDPLTEAIGFFNHITINKEKEQLLTSLDDTCFSETEENYLRKAKDFGFKSILIEPFINEDGTEERLHILFHYDYSILLCFDTFTWGDDGSWAKAGKTVPPPSVNEGKFYYNWSHKNDNFIKNGLTSSGQYISNGDKGYFYCHVFNTDLTPHFLPKELRDKEPKWDLKLSYDDFKVIKDRWDTECEEYLKDKGLINIWSGDHDCREALKHNITNLANNGTFVKKWKQQPFLWLLNYMDSKKEGYDYKEINRQRIAKLPIDVQELIKGE